MKQGKITMAYNTIMDLYRIKGLPYDMYLDLLGKKRELQIYVSTRPSWSLTWWKSKPSRIRTICPLCIGPAMALPNLP